MVFGGFYRVAVGFALIFGRAVVAVAAPPTPLLILPAIVAIGIQDAVVVLGVLIEVLRRDAIPGGLRITRQCLVLFEDLLGRAPDPAFRPVAVKVVTAALTLPSTAIAAAPRV